MNNEEIWKWVNIDGYRESHLISNFARIKTKNGRILKQRFDKDGYYQFNMYINGKETTRKTHRVLALTFMEEGLEENLVVNHKDGNKKNNSLDNLEWTTVSGNTQHSYDMGLQGKGCNHSKAKSVILYDDNWAVISQYETIKDFNEASNISRTSYKKLMQEERINIKFVDNITEGYPINKKLNKFTSKGYVPIKATEIDSGSVSLFESKSDVERKIGVNRKNIIPKNGVYKYKNKYYFEFISISEYLNFE